MNKNSNKLNFEPPVSGSSLLGKVLSKIENSYYFFEPFRLIELCLLANQTFTDELFAKITDEWTEKLFNCDLNETIFNVTFVQKLETNFSRLQMEGMLNRSDISSPWMDKFNRTDTIVLSEERKCKKSTFLVIKTIRTSNLERTWKLIQNFKNMKIVHLIRDPRARQNSQNKFSFTNHTWSKICENSARNLEIARKLINEDANFANNYYEFIYEKFAVDSTAYLENVVTKFLKRAISEELKSFVVNITTDSSSTQNEKLHYFEVTKRNISTISSKWRFELSSGLKKEIENNPDCQKIMQLVGYEH